MNISKKVKTGKFLLLRKATTFLSRVIFPLLVIFSILPGAQPVFGSALSDLAVSMQPGTWAQLATNNFNDGAILRPPSGGSVLEYTDKAGSWNPQNNTVMVLGGARTSSPSSLFAKYTDSSNTWVNNLPNPAPTFDNSDVYGWGTVHEYHHDTIVPATGDYYHRQFYTGKVMKFSHASQTWSQCSTFGSGNYQAAGALEYFPDRNSLVFLDGDWGVWELSLASGNCNGTWVQRASTNGGGFSPQLTGLGAYSNQSRYSSLCNCIVMGGGGGSNKLYRYNSNATFTAAADAPVSIGVPGAGEGSIFTVDPVSGLILVWHHSNGATTMYEYNPSANGWATISRTGPMFPGPEGGVTETIAVPIPSYGVIMFVQAGSAAGGKVYLYKHSTGSTLPPPPSDTTAPTTPSGLVATAMSSSQINLSWNASTDNVGVAGYKVSRNSAQVATQLGTAYQDTGLVPATSYSYTVAAYDAAGNTSAQSVSVSATTQAAPPPQTKPMGWWKFDEGTGTVASDSSGGGNGGTLQGPTWTTGVLSHALNFNGIDNYVRLGGTNLDNVNTFTYTAWIYPRSTGKGGYGVIAAKGGTGVGNKRFLTNNSCPGTSTLELTVERASGSASACAVAGSLALNAWQFVAATYTGADGPRIYKNGVELSYGARTVGSGTEISDAGTNLQIGSWYNTITGQFDGMIDDVRVYNLVLSQPEIQALYAQVSTIPPSSFDFVLSNGGNQSVTQGQSTSNNISINLVSGTAQAVTLSTSGLPSGALGTYSLASCTPTCSSSLAISTSTFTLTGSYPIVVTAVGGGVTKTTGFTLTVTSATAPPPVVGGTDFATRCSQPGVVKCVGFDSQSEITGTYGSPFGVFGGNPNPTLDSNVKASGNSSLKFTILPGTDGGSAGQYFTNFSDDFSVQFGENSEFYIQWRQRFSPEYLPPFSASGVKQAIIGTGDKPGCSPSNSASGLCYSSCSALEVVPQEYYATGFPIMYNSCTGSASHGPYDPFFQPFSTSWNGANFKLQNAMPSPYCLYDNQGKSQLPPTGNCFGYFTNEWMTFQVHIKTGPRVGDEFKNSFVELWIAREGQPSQLVISWGPYNLTAGPSGDNQRYGKIWLLPYTTDTFKTTNTTYTWYDELIISRSKISDPGATAIQNPPVAPTSLSIK